MTLSILDAGMIAAWIVVWFVVAGMFFGFIGAVKKRRQRTTVLSAAAVALTEKLKKSVYTQEEFDEIVRMMKKQNDK